MRRSLEKLRSIDPASSIHPSKVLLLGFLLYAQLVSPANSQTIPEPMCGDGTTLTIELPRLTVLPPTAWEGQETFRNQSVDEQIEIPNGCRIYALLISGYGRNADLDELSFYNFAKFVAENGGYVHYAWWNNLLKPYMAGPLHHPDSKPRGEVPNPVFSTLTPPIAKPDGDYQFQADARRFLQEIRAANPDAIVLVAGHSMGGGAAARLASTTPQAIDLLALLDPTGNRTLPSGLKFTQTERFTRWRGTRVASGAAGIYQEEFAGWKIWDCVRGPLGFCTLPYECHGVVGLWPFQEIGDVWLLHYPLIPTFAPIICPSLQPIFDDGRQRFFRPNVRRLYYRFQTEALPPGDYEDAHFFGRDASQSSGDVQARVFENAPGEQDPRKTCGHENEPDPLHPELGNCYANDGHGEIVGTRDRLGNQILSGVQARTTGGLRAQTAFAAMGDHKEFPRRFYDDGGRPIHDVPCLGTAEGCWPYRPLHPDLCIVCPELVEITAQILLPEPKPESLLLAGLLVLTLVRLLPARREEE